MKVVILAGGFGTRLAEHTDVVPKPMVEIGGEPILWHIMKLYAHHGFKDFVIALGYKGEVIKDYFLNYHSLQSDFTVELATGSVNTLYRNHDSDWKVTLVDTGKDSMTGGRIKRLQHVLGEEPFLLTYGDGVADIDVSRLVSFHQQHGKMLTLTAVHPKAHYGELEIKGQQIVKFMEKPEFRQTWINGGFMVAEPAILDFIEGDSTIFEREPLEQIAESGNLMAYHHDGFWQCMDNLRDVRYLNELWNVGKPPWAVWKNGNVGV